MASKCKMQISEHVLFIGNLERVLQIKALIGSYTNCRMNRKYRRSGMRAKFTRKINIV